MCGITGYIGNKNVNKELLENLKLLEYRGYDSAGIATIHNGKISVTKSSGKISNLEKIVETDNISKTGIAHTRWATHGVPNYENTHPHSSNKELWTVVHNGIIENFSELKNELINQNFSFKSQTDTEVISNLLEKFDCNNKLETLIKTCKILQGSFAIACLNKDSNNTIFLAKKKNPLYVAYENNEVFIASDPICFLNKTKGYYSLNDDQFCIANNNGLKFYNNNAKQINLNSIKIENFEISNSKQNYPHYMLKEINEVPEVLKKVATLYKQKNILNQFDKTFIKKYNKIVFIGCGTAYHAGLMGAKYIERFARKEAKAYIASEYRYSKPIINKKTLVVLVSQSGETADTLAVAELAKKAKATTIALTNVLYSSLAKMADYVLPVCAGTEIAVASTKAYSAQISILYMVARHFENVLKNKETNYINDIFNLANNFNLPTLKNVNKLAKHLKNEKKVFFIGRDFDYITCLEASLKLKEITYINTAEHPAGELKHGFLSMVDKNSTLFVIATQKELFDKTLNGAHESLARGGTVILVSQFKPPKEKTKNFYDFIALQDFNQELMPISSISYFQILAYATSILKNINPDQPRNLAKSVTVE